MTPGPSSQEHDGGVEVFLSTDRLLLRQFTMEDVELLVELDSDPEVMSFINGGNPTPRREIVEEVLPNWLAYYERSGHLGFWAAEKRGLGEGARKGSSAGEFVGWFHFRPGLNDDGARRQDSEPELGYRLRRSAWGKGYATEGSRALIDGGFTHHDVTQVFAETMVVNTASRRVMERCGMRAVRFFHADWPCRIPGDEHGDVEYAITRSEWEAFNHS